MPYLGAPKRTLDVVIASVALVVSSPLHALCGFLVWVTSGRPIYFKQERAGRYAEPFEIIKFRTMIPGAHESTGGYHTAASITPIGRVLRRSSLDELPQLFNVLRGDMSVVGPRPALLDQVRRYSDEQRKRLEVRPGLTGLAQIRFRNEAPWSARIRCDIEYVETCSLRSDFRIMLKTIPRVLVGGGVVEAGQTAAEVDDLATPSTSTSGA